jgi:Na+/glutamate symporter
MIAVMMFFSILIVIMNIINEVFKLFYKYFLPISIVSTVLAVFFLI